MADQLISLARAIGPHGMSQGAVGANVAATLFFGHRHTDGYGAFLAVGDIAGVVAVGQYP